MQDAAPLGEEDRAMFSLVALSQDETAHSKKRRRSKSPTSSHGKDSEDQRLDGGASEGLRPSERLAKRRKRPVPVTNSKPKLGSRAKRATPWRKYGAISS